MNNIDKNGYLVGSRLWEFNRKTFNINSFERIILERKQPLLTFLAGLGGARVSLEGKMKMWGLVGYNFYDYKFRAIVALYGNTFTVQEAKLMYFNERLRGKDY
jgi:hypothetical protein